MKKLILTLIVGLFMVGAASTAQAVVLGPVGTVFGAPGYIAAPDYGSGSLASAFYSFDMNSSAVDPVLGSIEENVYKNGTGILFVFDVSRNSTNSANSARNSLISLGSDDYAGFLVDANYDSATGVIPDSVARFGGSNVTFYWYSGLDANETSRRLLVQTDAQYFKTGNFSLQAGGNSEAFIGFGPTATPEPATMALFGTGLLGLLGLRRKRIV